MADRVQPFVVTSAQGEMVRGPAGGPVRFLARAGQTGGRLTVLESTVAPGDGPPLHVHPAEDEIYYVLGGQVRFVASGQDFAAPTGALVFIPRGSQHCFVNEGDEAARLLVLFSPSGMERFFEAFAAIPTGTEPAQAFREAGATAGMEVLGPPLRGLRPASSDGTSWPTTTPPTSVRPSSEPPSSP